jgi:surface protein
MYGRGYKFLTKDELRKAIDARRGDDGTANTWDVSAITDMSFLFRMTEFNEDISGWDTSNVITMEGMFQNSYFNNPLPWNVSKVTNMKGMFKPGFLPAVFNQPLVWDVSNVTTMEEMFFENKTFNQLLEWNTSSVTNMKNMFKLSIYNQPLPWDVSKVENMEGMFQLSQFDQDISGWKTSSVTNMKDMFKHCPFNHLLPWDVSNVVTMEGMFCASRFNQDISGWNVEKVTNMKDMFNQSKFNQSIREWNVEKVVEMTNIFLESPMPDRNKPPALKTIKKKITILILLHGENLKDELPTDLPVHASLAVRPGTCTYFFKKTTTQTLEKIEAIEEEYAGKKIFIGNDSYVKKYQPFEDSYFEENFEDAMKGTPGYTKEELFVLHKNRTSPFRRLKHNRSYTMLDDNLSVIMGIFIINAQENEDEIEITYPESIHIKPGDFTPSRLPYIKEDYMLLQRRNLLNVEVANSLYPGGFQLESEDDYTNIQHVPSITLFDILLFFKKLGYDYVNIIDEGCRVESIDPVLRDRKSFTEHRDFESLKDAYPDLGGTLKRKRNKNKTKYYVQRNNVRSTKRYKRYKRHTRNNRSRNGRSNTY